MRVYGRSRFALGLLIAIGLLLAAPFSATAGAQEANGSGGGAAAAGDVQAASAVPLDGLWQEFSFDGPGSAAGACGPCGPSSGGNSEFAGDPPWTFAAERPVILEVTDAFLRGDRFEVFDHGISLGLTQAPVIDGHCGSDPDPCSGDPAVSHRTFLLAPGDHSITIVAVDSPFNTGAGYFRVDDACGPYSEGSPVGCWRFGESAGSPALDGSPNANHGTYLGGPLLGVPGAPIGGFNSAVSMDGTNDHVSVPDDDSLDVGDSFTLIGNIKRDDDDKAHQMFLKGGKGFHLAVMSRFNGNQVYLRKAGVTTMVRSQGGVPADGAFHEVLAAKDGSAVRIAIDGVDQPLQVVSMRTIEDTAFPLTFSSSGASSVAGDLDEYAVLDEGLVASRATRAATTRHAQRPGKVRRARRSRGSRRSPKRAIASAATTCSPIGERDSGITAIRASGISCVVAKAVALAGAGRFKAHGLSCDVVDEDWTGTVRITTRCTGPAGARLTYTAVG